MPEGLITTKAGTDPARHISCNLPDSFSLSLSRFQCPDASRLLCGPPGMHECHCNTKTCPNTKTCLSQRSGLPGVLVVLRRDPLKVDASPPDERPLLDSQPADGHSTTMGG